MKIYEEAIGDGIRSYYEVEKLRMRTIMDKKKYLRLMRKGIEAYTWNSTQLLSQETENVKKRIKI